jgi:hypothetical protein
VQVIDFSKQIPGTGMKCAPVLRQLHAACCPVQKPDTDVAFQLSDGRGGPPFLDAQAIGRAGEAPHFGDRHEYEDGLEVLHFHALDIVPHEKNSAFDLT